MSVRLSSKVPCTFPLRQMAVAGSLAIALGGCATFTPNGGMSPVATAVSADLGKDTVKITSVAEAANAAERVRGLLSHPLSADSAVQVALLNNRGLQAEYNTLGISEAAFVEASLPPSPTFSIERLATGGGLDIERRLVANILALLTLPARKDIARTQFEVARYRAIEATFRLAADTRRAYFRALAAGQTVGFLQQARLSAEAAGDLSRKLGQTGASTKLDQARSAAFYAEVSNQLAEARLRAGTDREALTRLMGLWGRDIDYKLPAQLPNLPARLPSSQQIEAEAIRRRVDLIAARLELDAMAKSLGLTEATRFVSILDMTGLANYGRTIEDGRKEREYPRGFELEIQVPIFDLGETGVRRSRETYMQAVNRLVEKAVNVRSEVRSAYLTYRGTYDISRQYQTRILPLRKTINEQALLEYSGMLIDVFDLLTTARESITTNIAAITAKRDFLIAGVDFQTAVIGGGSGAAGGDEPSVATAASAAEH
jgi:outer membrane protein TolC